MSLENLNAPERDVVSQRAGAHVQEWLEAEFAKDPSPRSALDLIAGATAGLVAFWWTHSNQGPRELARNIGRAARNIADQLAAQDRAPLQ